MRRQTSAGEALPAGSSRVVRLDPHSLPVRFSARDARADGGVREIELGRDRVVLRRAISGIPMALQLRVAEFRGIGLHVIQPDSDAAPLVMLVLEHQDPSLSVPLMMAPESPDIAQDWARWSETLALPRLMTLGEQPAHALGISATGPAPRRRRRNAVHKRRPFFLRFRRAGEACAPMPVHRDEREIIART